MHARGNRSIWAILPILHFAGLAELGADFEQHRAREPVASKISEVTKQSKSINKLVLQNVIAA
jgi:hypothetical protein